MGTIADRKMGALLGAAVADAAAQPLHWVYDLQKLETVTGGKEEIEFHNPAANPYYRIEVGRNSCYGDQAFVLLESLAHCKGFDEADFSERTYQFFGPNSEYENPAIKNYVAKQALTSIFPIKGPWRNFSIKHFLKNYEDGSETDDQMDCVAKIAPIVAFYAGSPELMFKVEDAIRVTQNNDFTVSIGMAASRLIEHYILHGPDADAVEEIIRQLRDSRRDNPQQLDTAMAGMLRQVIEVKDKPHAEVTKLFRND